MANRDETADAILDKIDQLLKSITNQSVPSSVDNKASAIKNLAEARAWVIDVNHATS